jgi:hypothetical protein
MFIIRLFPYVALLLPSTPVHAGQAPFVNDAPNIGSAPGPFVLSAARTKRTAVGLRARRDVGLLLG